MVFVSRKWSITLVVVASFMFLLGSVGFWMRTNVLQEDSFVAISTESLSGEEVRLAIGNRIVDAALEDRPIVRNFLRDPASELIAGVLGTSLVEGVLELVARVLYEVLVYNRGDRVAINLEPIKDFIVNILNVLAPEGSERIDGARIPNEIIILEEGDLPPIQDYIIAIEWITLGLGLASVGLVALVLSKSWAGPERDSYLKWIGGSLAVGAFVLLLLTWSAGSTATLSISDETGRVVVSETYGNLVTQLRIQSLGLVVIGIGVWLIGWWLMRESVQGSLPVAATATVESVPESQSPASTEGAPPA